MAVYNIRCKQTEDAEYQVHQPRESPTCYLGEGRSSGASYPTMVFEKYRITALLRRKNNLCYQIYNERESHSHRGSNERPTISSESQI